MSALYHVNSHTKGTLCHFIFSRLQNPGFFVVVSGRGHFLVVVAPVVLPHGAPAAAVDHHTTGSQMSPFTDKRSELDLPYLPSFCYIRVYSMYIISDIIMTRNSHDLKVL